MESDYDYEFLCSQIRQMPSWKIYAIAAACAEKVAPIVQSIGLKSTWLLSDECLRFIWTAPLDHPKSDEANRLIQAVEMTPEWDCDGDNHYLPFEVARALDRIHLALRTIAVSQPRENIEALISLMRDLADSWDSALSRVKWPAEFAERRCLESSEVASQERLINMLATAGGPSNGVVERVRAEAQSVGVLFREAVPFYCFAFLSG